VVVKHCGVGKEDKNWVELEEAVFQRLRGGIEGEESQKGQSVWIVKTGVTKKKKKKEEKAQLVCQTRRFLGCFIFLEK